MLKVISIFIDLRSLLLLDTLFHLITKFETVEKPKGGGWMSRQLKDSRAMKPVHVIFKGWAPATVYLSKPTE